MSGIALKLTSLLVRTVAKPFATGLKAQAKEHELFRNACIRIAQTVHSTDLKLRMSLLGEKKIKIRPLNDNKAIDNGATFLSELFIFSVAGSLILYESYRSRKKAIDQHDALADDISILQNEIEYLKSKFGELNVKLDDYKVPDGVKPKYIKLDRLAGNGGNKPTVDASITSATGTVEGSQTQISDPHVTSNNSKLGPSASLKTSPEKSGPQIDSASAAPTS